MLLKTFYYSLRPAIPYSLRMLIRRRWAQRQRRYLTGTWPISEVAGKKPDGWPGWPDGKQFALVLTHDVEGRKGLERCGTLAELEMQLGLRSAFNFVPEGEYVTPDSVREFLTTNGFEVGVHDLRHDGKLYRSPRHFAANVERINHYLGAWNAAGFRAGAMLHDLSALAALNILYDASTFDIDPFEPQPDGVNTIFPFLVPREDGSAYVELPYTLPQDLTLFLLLQETSIDIWKAKLDWIAQRGGMALLDAHPDYMGFDGRKCSAEYDSQLYREFVCYALQRYGDRCWFAVPRDVATYISQAYGMKAAGLEARRGAESHSAPLSGRNDWRLRGKRAAVLTFSPYPIDARPRRAAEALVEQGMNVEIICISEEPGEPRREAFKGVDVLRLPFRRRRGGKLTYILNYASFIGTCFAILAARACVRNYALVHVHNMPDVLVLSSLIPKALGAKVILDLHDPMPELMMTIFGMHERSLGVRLLKRIEKASIRLADAVITVNMACQKIFSARSCPEEKVTTVMNAPDERIFHFTGPRSHDATLRDAGKPFVIMYHGSSVERNGLDLAVEALAQVRRSVPTAELWIYGPRSNFLDRVLASARRLGLHDAVRHLGPRLAEDIAEAIKECDVGIVPNRRSIFSELNTPTRIFEYLAFGKPVIAPRAAGIQDYFDDDNLVFFELGNSEDLARQIEYVFFHPEETIEVVERGQKVYLTHTWTQEKSKLVSLVGSLLESQRQAAAVGQI
jgi:glycosyltransferase involved in cell wall biosynthesis